MRLLLAGSLLLLGIGAVVGIVAVSPIVLDWSSRGDRDWARLGDAGQAYGGASAVLSGLALCGIALSLALQWRQARIAQLYSARHHQLDLAKLALDHPDSFIVDGVQAPADPHARVLVIVNLWVANWATAWQLGAMGEEDLRSCGARLFQTDYARRWWRAWSTSYATSPRGRRFVELLDRECDSCEATARATPSAPSVAAAPAGHDAGTPWRAAALFAAGVSAACLVWLLRRPSGPVERPVQGGRDER
ncbi:hypothetical protein GCM10018962_87760 [Dactylosporangium matsuzakiense]|uniref:Uncharacterized protein n=2 Tax=Dactylosporangium matsuzakiense TaxID=53360 RepID=A0A9W6KLX9_9ACTN|nr:hypothetical protein GCM10017581_034760 [Dactylosporangium matsuzakiense]